MIRFFKWLIVSVVATIVFSITGIIGFVLGQFKYLFQKGAKGYIRYWIDLVGGIFTGASHILEGYSLGIDIMANASGGEGLEWICTKEKKDIKTLLGTPDATISAGIGDIKAKGYLTSKLGMFIDNSLNIVFNQKDHGSYALRSYRVNKELNDKIESHFGRKEKGLTNN